MVMYDELITSIPINTYNKTQFDVYIIIDMCGFYNLSIIILPQWSSNLVAIIQDINQMVILPQSNMYYSNPMALWCVDVLLENIVKWFHTT